MTVDMSRIQVAALQTHLEAVFQDIARVNIACDEDRAIVHQDHSLSHLLPLLSAYEQLLGVLPIVEV
jgi:hypothetical protein